MSTLSYAEIFAREAALIGQAGVKKLAAASVAVCGLGGVGSYLVEALARSAIGKLLLIDFDQVAVSNINRQLCALSSTVGRDKAYVIAERIREINPFCELRIAKVFIDENIPFPELLAGIDYIGDAIDYVPGKIALIEYAYQQQIPIIAAMGAGRRLDPSKLMIADIAKTYGCPLAKNIRKRLRERGIYSGVKVVFSTEPPLPTEGDELGSMAFVPAVAGMMMAAQIVRDILDG